jgi:hypothetical protein
MQENGWEKRISKSGWEFLTQDQKPGDVAVLMTRLYELGWRGPEFAPQINPLGTNVLWKSPNTEGIPVLTSEGLLSFYRERGHRWFLLRVPQLLRGCSGPNAARLQEVLANYEEQCKSDAVEPLPSFVDITAFVGGEGDNNEVEPETIVTGLLEG